MVLLSFLYLLYLRLLSLPLILALYIIGWKKQVVRENRVRCLPTPPPFFRMRFYAHASMDFLRLVHGHYGRPLRIREQDRPKLKKLKAGASLLLTAHFHHWEWMGAWLTREGVPLRSAARPMSSPSAERRLARIRGRHGMAITHGDIPRRALRHLDKGGCFGLIWDQRVQRSDLRAPFFGAPLLLDPLPLFLLRHKPVPVYFAALLPGGSLRILTLHANRPSSSLSTREPEVVPAAHRLARRYHRVLEILVRRHPTWWYGFAHRRFRDAPPPPSPDDVSRETLPPSGLRVSRETKLSP